VQRRAADVLHILDVREIPLTDLERERITTCEDRTELECWFDRAIAAESAAEVFYD
jgi:hypothetical protein